MQFGIFDVDNRLRRLSKMGDALERINRIVDWEMFRPIIESALVTIQDPRSQKHYQQALA